MEIKTEEQMNDQIMSARDKVVVIYFGGAFCAPCKAVKPIIKSAEETYKDKVICLYIDESAEPECMTKFDVFSLPTIIFIKNGEEQTRANVIKKEQFNQILDKLL